MTSGKREGAEGRGKAESREQNAEISAFIFQLTWVLGSLGLLAAAASIVFGDLIYNVVARTILVSQNLVAVGNWISIPALSIDGQVRTVGSFLIEVENWDKSVATVPPRYLLTNSFRSWQQMARSGSRRIMHTLTIDLASVRPADAAMLAEARTLPGAAAYLDGRRLGRHERRPIPRRPAGLSGGPPDGASRAAVPRVRPRRDAPGPAGAAPGLSARDGRAAQSPARRRDLRARAGAGGTFGLYVYQAPGDHALRDAVAPVERD